MHFVAPRADWKLFAVGNAFNFDLDAAVSYIVAQRRLAGNLPVIFSHERLSGNPFSGHFDQKEIAERIHQAAGGCQVLLIIREQYSLMASCYSQYVVTGGTKNFEEFVKPVKDGHIPLFDAKALEYHRYIAHLVNLFGAERVRILPFELLLFDAPGFLAESVRSLSLATHNYSDQDFKAANRHLELDQIEIQRKRNLLRATPRSFRDPLLNRMTEAIGEVPLECFLSPNKFLGVRSLEQEAERLFPNMYNHSNELTSKLIGLHLGAFGYRGEQ